MTALAIPDIEARFSDRRWRLNSLYTIKDKSGVAVPFRLNPAQVELLDDLHCLELILKARQMGYTTLIQLLMLDACLFNSNTSAGVIAHTREDAEAFFADKIKFAYDNLDPEIRRVVSATQDSTKSLAFSNGSKIRVGTSLRGGTFQFLHVSEFGKICARYPEKAKEIVTGAFNTVQAGQFIAVESTAEGQGGYFHDMVMAARKLRDEKRPITQMDFKLHFSPWWKDASYQMTPEDAQHVVITKEDDDYFDSLYERYAIELTNLQEAWYVKKRSQQGDAMKREFPSTEDEAFEASVEGAYLTKEMARVRREGRICKVPVENVPVDTFWDLGINDDMVIWFRQTIGPEHRYLDYYANSGEGLAHYGRILQEKANEREWVYGAHHLPHDGGARRLGFEAKTVQQMLTELGVKPCIVVPRIANEKAGIEATRAYLPRCWFDEKHTADGVRCLDNYRREWDEERAVWKDHPRHDANSHGYKALETAAVARVSFDYDEFEEAVERPSGPHGGY